MPETPSGLRRQLSRARRVVRLPRTVAALKEQTTKRLARQQRQIDKLTSGLAEVKVQLRPLVIESNHRDFEHGTLTAQVGVLEERFGALERRLASGRFVAEGADAEQARSLVEEVQREHQQVRVRMQVIAQYEERLRRVEEALLAMADGDHRRLV